MIDYLWIAKKWKHNRGMVKVFVKNHARQMKKRMLTVNQHSA